MKTRLFFTAANGQSSCNMFTVSKAMLNSGVQMLLKNERTLVSEGSDAQIMLQNHGGNNFSLEVINLASPLPPMARITPSSIYCSEKQQNVPDHDKQPCTGSRNMQLGNIAHHIHKQMLPLYSECVLTSRDMQDCFGKITYAVLQKHFLSSNKKMSDSFMLDNAVSIGMLTGILNRKWHGNLKQCLHSANDKPLSVYSGSLMWTLQRKWAKIFSLMRRSRGMSWVKDT
jgi:hypothetical protein